MAVSFTLRFLSWPPAVLSAAVVACRLAGCIIAERVYFVKGAQGVATHFAPPFFPLADAASAAAWASGGACILHGEPLVWDNRDRRVPSESFVAKCLMVETGTSVGVEYRDIAGSYGYRVGSDGSVWSRRPRNARGNWPSEWRKLRPVAVAGGYATVNLYAGAVPARHIQKSVHRLVLGAFVGPCPSGMEGLHINGDARDNRLENLRWGTRRENCADTVRHGRTTRGERNKHAKLDESAVRRVRDRIAAGESRQVVAADFGISLTHTRAIVARRFWKHI